MRKKLTEEQKKRDFSVSIDENVSELLEKYLVNNNIKNRSKYIEKLVKDDLRKRGENIDDIENEF